MIEISETTTTILTTCWVILMILILFLNLPVGYLFWSSHQLQSPRNMYIASMIVSDLVLALMIPIKIYWIYGVAGVASLSTQLCVAFLVLQTVFLFVNVYSVLGLTLVRHRYITRPKEDRQNRREASYFIVLLWGASLLSSFRLPHVVNSNIPSGYHKGHYSFCWAPTLYEPNMNIFFFIVDFCFPIGTIYALCLDANQHLRRVRHCKESAEGAACRKRDCRVVRMVLALANCYVALQLPNHLLRIISFFLKNPPIDRAIVRLFQKEMFVLLEVGHMLMFCTGASNVFVYVFFNRQAASVFLTLIRLRRKSQVGTLNIDMDVVTPSSDQPASGLRRRVSVVVSSLFRPSMTPQERSSPSITHATDIGGGGGGGGGGSCNPTKHRSQSSGGRGSMGKKSPSPATTGVTPSMSTSAKTQSEV